MDETAPIPSATVLLLRDGSDGLEVFMVVRHHQIDFASGALVFPGGKVDARDQDERFTDLMQPTWATPEIRVLQIAAIREVFEECGILLARRSPDTRLLSREAVASLDHYRALIHKGDLAFADFLIEQKLMLATDQLQLFAHWITPDIMRKRFDTLFYLAVAPDQQASHDQKESVDSVWIRPAKAIVDAAAGQYSIIFPTMRNIVKLAKYRDTQAAFKQTKEEKIVTVKPWTEKRADGLYLCITPEAGYDKSEEKMPERLIQT